MNGRLTQKAIDKGIRTSAIRSGDLRHRDSSPVPNYTYANQNNDRKYCSHLLSNNHRHNEAGGDNVMACDCFAISIGPEL
eukprot:scaffold134321_cov18-Prasinocladus_malaysianus.AAC.1